VLALELLLEAGDLLILGVGVVASPFVADGEGSLGVVEELLLPVCRRGWTGMPCFSQTSENRDFFRESAV